VDDARDARIRELEEELRRALEREKTLGALVAQQQTLIVAQQQLIADLQRRLVEQDAAHTTRTAALETEVKRLEKQILGPKTERMKVPPVERELMPPASERSEEENAARRAAIAQKRRERALAKAAVLETENVAYPVPEELRRCPKCHGDHFRRMADEESATFEYIPGTFVRRIHKREKLSCSCGEHIVTAPGPAKLVAGGQYGFSFAAFLVVEKCVDSIPIHRVEKRFARLGIPVSRSTMNEIVHTAADVAMPLALRLEQRVAMLPIVLADETSMRLQDRAKRGFIWVFHGHDDVSGGRLARYVFATSRSGETAARVLGGTQGTLVVDGYTGYNVVTDPEGRQRAGCWSHLRRKIFEAREHDPPVADRGLALIRDLFRVEHDAKQAGIVRSSEHLTLRSARSKLLVEDFFSWAKSEQAKALPKGPLGEALTYASNQRERLELFLSDARIPLHNNSSEAMLVELTA
jgi:transposase